MLPTLTDLPEGQKRLGGSGGSSLPPDLPSLIAARYRGRFVQGFVRGKLSRDPAIPALLGLAPLGEVLDLGCGRGQLALALLQAGAARHVTGFDIDAGKIAQARAAARDLPAAFAVADLAAAGVPPADTILLIDVLLQLPRAGQDGLLARIIAAAPRRVLIRAFDPAAGWRAGFGFAMERARRVLGGDRGRAGALEPRPLADLAAPLVAAGYRVAAAPCRAGTPLPNVLLVAERP